MNKMTIPILLALATAVFWGCYGPAIGNARLQSPSGAPMWSPYKPYVFVGIAYLVIAIIGGLIMMGVKGDSFSYTGDHYIAAKWGFLAGVVGAFGALTLTSAMMISRGNAHLVMPIVFGGAVTVTAIISMLRLGALGSVSPLLWLGMALVFAGVVLIAKNTPHAQAATKPAAQPAAAYESTGTNAAGTTPTLPELAEDSAT